MNFFSNYIIGYFIRLFTLPKVKEVITRSARLFLGEASRYSAGMKGEAIEAKESFIILTKYLKKEKLTHAEKKQFKSHTISILKSAGVVVPVMLIPLPFVSTLLLIIMDHLLMSLNIQILPPSFYPADKKGIMTKEGINKDLQKEVFGQRSSR